MHLLDGHQQILAQLYLHKMYYLDGTELKPGQRLPADKGYM